MRKNDKKKFALSAFLILAISLVVMALFGITIMQMNNQNKKEESLSNNIEYVCLKESYVDSNTTGYVCDTRCIEDGQRSINREPKLACFDGNGIKKECVVRCCVPESLMKQSTLN